MAKVRTSFICQQCGASSPAFLGRCHGCGAWNSMIETIEERRQPGPTALVRSKERPQPLSTVGGTGMARTEVPIGELDRVLGGGLVPGSLVLIGGDPGIGKSTLVLQAAAALAA
ncbi:MAG TPA: DNA repair protein RadA, partial [Methyloceanibacter sp.]|nr:DNA repair protein RadA [Methyloceanibacter sp.]